MEYLEVNKNSEQPIYKQIIESVCKAIERGELVQGDKIPSLNEIKAHFSLSRDTVLTAFTEMKNRAIISSSPGKGYYVSSTNTKQKEKVFLLFDEFNAFKEDVFNAFIESIGSKAMVDIYFHHFNAKVLETLINQNKNDYTSFVIMPGSIKKLDNELANLPLDKTYILDRKIESKLNYTMLVQDFEEDIQSAMVAGMEQILKYSKLLFISQPGKEPVERVIGFQNFCKTHNLNAEVVSNVDLADIKEGNAFFVPNDRHLVQLIKEADEKKLKLGENFGVVSFNDTMLKEVVAGGITTISTDFKLMGKHLAQLVLEGGKGVLKNKSNLILRNSL